MTYAGEVSMFSAELPRAAAGRYTLRVIVSNPKTVNFAMYESQLDVKKP